MINLTIFYTLSIEGILKQNDKIENCYKNINITTEK